MHDDFGCELEENELEKTEGESEARPVGAVFQDLQTVTIELDIAIKVHVVESLHWNLGLSAISQSIGLILECEIMLDGTSWQFDFLVYARAEA